MVVLRHVLFTEPRMRSAFLSLVLITSLLGIGWRVEAASSSTDFEPDLPPGWSLVSLPGAHPDVTLTVLTRSALTPPSRYRLVVLPGSGCTGWLPVAERYFAGLLHAELLVLHKPGVDVSAGLGTECTPDFVQRDTLTAWRDHAVAALQAHFSVAQNPAPTPPPSAPMLPTLLMGISEGAELLPDLANHVPMLAGVVMISAPGLDPREAGELQARRRGQSPSWQALERAQASDASDHAMYEGRTLKYWRDFWHWQLAQPLLDVSWPLLRVWGDADALVPVAAYDRFAQQSHSRTVPMCDLRLPDADHALQSGQADQRDGLQWLWARLEVWARRPTGGFCALVMP